MSDEEFKAEAPATAAPKKPRAKKTPSPDSTVEREIASPAPAAGDATPPVSSPGTELAVQPDALSDASSTSSTDASAFGAAAAKVSAMIPENVTVKAREIAVDVKDKTSDAVQGLARIINDSAGAIDDNVGPKYGDYARTAAQSVSDAADRLRAKPVDEIAADTREFVRAKPGAALGIAAVSSLVLAKIFGSVFGKKR
ncbi:hypothetical protein [Blastomonas aquatica]|uniref:DUF883 domain-containing protein n=1 Tax=Blastomonas aquatica TaxID=1510276 RepID=A0ABQ1J5R5_9SPHN|nr:hypothetical protein [Blastomonas aquatica]GGB60537.1 hypothetical protein GCM10010833_14280 [Blastomonas aquatica]